MKAKIHKKVQKVIDCFADPSEYDPSGSYTGNPIDCEHPTQDVDDL